MADKNLLNGNTPNGQIKVITNGNGAVTIGGNPGDNPDMNRINKVHHEASYDIAEPPDGGLRGWMVMVSAFLCNGVLFGIINTYSVIHSYLQQQLSDMQDTEASSKAALVGSLAIGTTFLLSPISGVLTDKIGLRRTTLLGGILSAGGMFISSYCTHSIEALYFTYGLMFGLGAALAYTPTLAILGHYFKRYLGKVNGFVTAGSSVFTAILPLALDYLIKKSGLRVTLICMSAILSFIILCAFVYKPLHPPPPPQRTKPGRSQVNTFMRTIINVDIWKKKRYIIWALSIPLALFGYFVPYVHMVKFVQIAFPNENQNLPVMFIGISSGIGRLIFGVIADIQGVNRVFLQQISLMMIGVLTMLLPATSSYIILLIITFSMGLFDGCFISLLGPIAYELCGPRGATQAIGFLLGFSSIPLTVGPPIAGKLFDSTGSYTIPFVIAGIPPLIGASILFLIRCVKDEGSARDAVKNDPTHVPLTKTAWDIEEKPVMNGNSNHNGDYPRKASLATTGISTKTALLSSSSMSSLVTESCTITYPKTLLTGRRYPYSIL